VIKGGIKRAILIESWDDSGIIIRSKPITKIKGQPRKKILFFHVSISFVYLAIESMFNCMFTCGVSDLQQNIIEICYFSWMKY
jgi:hypothetical protein